MTKRSLQERVSVGKYTVRFGRSEGRKEERIIYVSTRKEKGEDRFGTQSSRGGIAVSVPIRVARVQK